jgi:hypothetical protein
MLQCGFVRWNFSLAILALHPSILSQSPTGAPGQPL